MRRASQDAAGARDTELREIRAELSGLRGMRDELRGFQRALPAPPDPQVAQTLQLIASKQQLLLVRSLQRAPAEQASRRPQARRSRKPLRPGCTSH